MRKTVNINDNWVFTKKFESIPRELPHDRNYVNLPHTWNDKDGQDGGNDYFRGRCCYAKKLSKSDLPVADHYYLEINGANSSAEVFMNGKLLGKHDGGYSTWRVNITDELTDGGILAITVDNAPNDKVYPQSADFTFYGGLYRDVNIVCVPDVHFDLLYFGGCGLKVTPTLNADKIIRNGEKCYVDANVEIVAFPVNADGAQIKFIIKDADKQTVAETVTDATHPTAHFRLNHAHLWNGLNDPYLYTVEAYLMKEGEILDNVCLRSGTRAFEIDADKGFILNESPYPLRGVSRHQDRLGIGNALLPEHHREDIDLICEIGANAVRLAHYQHGKYFMTCATSVASSSGRKYRISLRTWKTVGQTPFLNLQNLLCRTTIIHRLSYGRSPTKLQ